jgi:hypothetical protein
VQRSECGWFTYPTCSLQLSNLTLASSRMWLGAGFAGAFPLPDPVFVLRPHLVNCVFLTHIKIMHVLRRLFGPPASAPPRLRDLERRVVDLEGDVEFLNEQLQKLRGRVTGGIRNRAGEATTAPTRDPRIPAGLDPKSEAIWLRRLTRGDGSVQVHG